VQPEPLTPWPRLRQTWWVYVLVALVLGLHCAGLVERLRCAAYGRCGSPVAQLVDLDALGGLPRLVTTAFFVATAVLAARARRSVSGRPVRWWTAVAGFEALLAVAKLFSVHSIAKADAALLTLLGGIAVTAVSLVVLYAAGRRWRVAATVPVVLAMACYAFAAIGLDAVTSLVAAIQSTSGALTEAAATFVEELGEALTALVLLVTVRWQAAVTVRAAPRPEPEPVLLRR
jgi:hypothetical protein